MGMDGVARYVAGVLAHAEVLQDTEAKTKMPAKAQSSPSPSPSPSMAMLASVIGPDACRRAAGPSPHAEALPARVLRGAPPAVAHFTEHGLRYAVDLEAGHKTGAYLDLRALRHALAVAPLTGARVLNLFSYTGMLGRAVEAAVRAIVQVDASARALAFAAAHHVVEATKHRFIEADVFDWLPAHDAAEPYDLVIVDPPAMTSRKAQVPQVLVAYHKLYRAAARHVKPGGMLVAACCTSRVTRDAFARTVRAALGPDFGHTQIAARTGSPGRLSAGRLPQDRLLDPPLAIIEEMPHGEP